MELEICEPGSNDCDYDSDDENIIAHTDDILPHELDSVLEQLLQSAWQDLVTIRIRGVYSLGKLSFPPLVNLKMLVLTDRFGGMEGRLWEAIVTIDYGRDMPKLEEMEVIIRSVSQLSASSTDSTSIFPLSPNFNPITGSTGSIRSCKTVRKLALELEVRKLRLGLIQQLFPKVSSLSLRVNDTLLLGRDPVPLTEICQIWPDLEELKITGHNNLLQRNYDADFAGIFEEEAQFLREKDEEHLEKLEIVPIKPSLLTMPSLQRLWIQLGFEGSVQQRKNVENPLVFLSKVTEIVVFKRMTHAEDGVYSIFASSGSSCSGSSDDDDGSEADEWM